MASDTADLIVQSRGNIAAHKLTDGKPKHRISPKVLKAVQLLGENPNMLQKDAAKLAGVSPVWLCQQLKKSHVNDYLARERKQDILGPVTAARAARAFKGLLSAESEKVRADVADRLLTATGDLPNAKGGQTRIGVNVAVTAGYVIKLRDHEPGEAPTIDAQATIITDGA